MESTVNLPVVGMDIAKNVFQLHVVDTKTGEVQRHKLKRDRVAAFFANHERSLVAMEACGGAHHWARTLRHLGHEVKLLPAKHVRPFVLRDKTDARDAQAIWVAAQQPHIRAVPVKSEQQQACLALHRMRAQLMKMRIMQTNALRGLLYEFGIVLPEGHQALLKRIPDELAKAQENGRLSEIVVVSVQEQLKRISHLQQDIDQLDRRLVQLVKQNFPNELEHSLNEIGVPCAKVRSLHEFLSEVKDIPELSSVFRAYPHGSGQVVTSGLGFSVRENSNHINLGAPALGEDTMEILASLGLDTHHLKELVRKGIVKTDHHIHEELSA